MLKKFKDLTEKEILAIAIGAEEEDGRIYGEFADALREDYPSTADMFEDMLELEATRFYARAASRTTDISTRELLNKLADEERKHTQTAGALEEKHLTASAKAQEDESQRKLFLLQVIQPGLLGLMDGSISTLAPLFAAAFAFQNSWKAFLVGLAASVGAGISMGFSESQSDDGSLTGRGSPWLRGSITGLMTTAGGLGHTLPYLIGNFHLATTIAIIVVAVELLVISYVRHRFMDTPFLQAAFQVIVGGVLVFLTGWLIGSS
jgi:rubrerythrin